MISHPLISIRKNGGAVVSNAEEYLDDLLKSLSNMEDLEDTEEKLSTEEELFLKDFEQDLEHGIDEDFLRQFEAEVNTDSAGEPDTGTESTQELLDNLDGSTDDVQETAELLEQPAVEDVFSPDAEPDVLDAVPDNTSDMEIPNITGEESDEDFMALLSGMSDNEAADMGQMPVVEETAVPQEMPSASLETGSSDNIFGLDGLDGLDSFGEADLGDLENIMAGAVSPEEAAAPAVDEKGTQEKKAKKEKKDKKDGFLGKLSLALFGEDEEDSSEEDALLKELAAAGDGAEKPEDPKEKKKREKAEKKEQKKKEKEAKKAEKAEKAAKKPKKQKKPKAPKVKDNTPPLPKKPVILIVVMAASIFALIMLGSNAVGYSVAKGAAKDAYAVKDYVKAYTELEGYKIKEKDEEFFYKAGLLATLQEQYNTYQSMMSLNENEMALDCLIRGVGRYYKNFEDATNYGIAPEFTALKNQIVQELNDTFGVDEEQALAVYNQRGRKNYTLELKKILNDTGME